MKDEHESFRRGQSCGNQMFGLKDMCEKFLGRSVDGAGENTTKYLKVGI